MQAVQHHDNSVVVTLPFRASSVGNARSRLMSHLASARVPPRPCEDSLIVLSELVGNSVRHAQPLDSGRLLVSWSVEPDAVVVSVTDGGSGSAPRVAHSADDALGGRGMAIVESLARRWFVRRGAESSTVTAEIPLR